MLGRATLGVMALVLGFSAGEARATYSIAAVDQSTQQVGGAVTSCVGALDVGIVYGSLPGVGVIHAQAQLDQRGRAKQRAIELMMMGVAPSEIIAHQALDGDTNDQARWCAEVKGTGGFIPWSQFNTACWDGSGKPYARQPISGAMLLVPGATAAAVAFEVCLESLAEATAPAPGG